MRVMSRPERERIEHDRLSSDAAFSDASSGRLVPEVPDPLFMQPDTDALTPMLPPLLRSVIPCVISVNITAVR